MDWIGQITLILLIKFASPATITTTSLKPTTVIPTLTSPVTPVKNEILKTSNTYQVTENIIDIPDNRTLPSIIPNFGIARPLNFVNNNVVNIVKVNKSEESSEETTDTDIGGNVKKNSFSILHIKAEYDDKPPQPHQNVFRKVFGGIKDYMYHVKKGVVHGLHSFFHRHDDDCDKIVKEPDFHDKYPNFHNKFPNRYDKFHRSFRDDDDFDSDYDDESNEYF